MAKSDTRLKILNTAAELFRTKGYYAVGLNEIIKASGAPKGSLYYYFPKGKEQLASEAVRFVGQRLRHEVEEQLYKVDDAAASLQNLLKNMAADFNTRKNNYFSVALLALETVENSGDLKTACREVFDEWADMYRLKLIRSGFCNDNAHRISIMLQTLIEGMFTFAIAKNDPSVFLLFAEIIPKLLES